MHKPKNFLERSCQKFEVRMGNSHFPPFVIGSDLLILLAKSNHMTHVSGTFLLCRHASCGLTSQFKTIHFRFFLLHSASTQQESTTCKAGQKLGPYAQTTYLFIHSTQVLSKGKFSDHVEVKEYINCSIICG